MNKNLTIKMGNCNYRRYYAALIDLVRSGAVDPIKILTKIEPMQRQSRLMRPSTGENPVGSRLS
jgi:threonine dehydrogenase-like Zn-dependent dehydrogenase